MDWSNISCTSPLAQIVSIKKNIEQNMGVMGVRHIIVNDPNLFLPNSNDYK